MSIYVISDLHLGFFPGADKPMDVFGPRWLDHAQRLARSWRETVAPGDTVVIPGDISWGLKLEQAKYDLDWVDQLPGRKIILKGNHDLWWSGITRLNRMYDDITFLQNDYAEAEGCYICGSRGWLTPDNEDFTAEDEKIYRRELLRLESSLQAAAKAREAAKAAASLDGAASGASSGSDASGASSGSNASGASAAPAGEPDDHPILGFLHFPPVSDAGRFSGFQQLFDDYGVRDVYYGHVHGEDGFRGSIKGTYHGVTYHLVSLDYLQCQPLRIR